MRLSDIQERSAVSYNSRNMRRIGWIRQVAKVVGLVAPGGAATQQGFAQALATWQNAQSGLKPDGKLGSATWTRMTPLLAKVASTGPVPMWVNLPPPRPTQSRIEPLGALSRRAGEPSWIGVARQEMRRWDQMHSEMTAGERKNTEEHTDMDEAYFAASPRWAEVTHEVGEGPGRKNRDWCAAFVNYCLHRAGYSHTGSAGAASFAKHKLWSFNACEEPRVGCIIVLGDRPGSHVGFLADTRSLPSDPRGDVAVKDLPTGGVKLLGGNQNSGGDRVCEKQYTKSLLSAKGENGVVSPYFWPLRGGADCNHAVPTARAHGCKFIHQA